MQSRQPTPKQSGFSAIEVLFVVLVVVALAVIGFVVYQRHKSISTKSTATSNTTQTTTRPAQTATQYLTIKEWGVRLKLNSDTASLYYYIKPNLPDVTYLSLKTVSDVAPNCAADKGSLAAIGRLTEADQQALVSNSAPGIPGTVHIGSYWYSFDHSHADCTDGTAAMQAAVSKAAPNLNANLLQNTFKTLEEAPTQYLTITEWGIKAKLDYNYSLRYKIWPSNPNIADFTSDQLTAASSSPGCGIGLTPDGMPYNHGGGSIRRLKGNDLLYAPEIATYTAEQFATDPKYAASRADITKVGDYYYFYYHEQGPCADTGFVQEQTENAVRYLLQSFQPE